MPKFRCLLLLLALLLLAPAAWGRPPGPDLEALLARMTLAEKLGQLQMLDGDADGTYRAEHPGMIREGRLGSTLNVRGAARVNELQRIAMEQSRLKIPMLFAFDVIHGYRTIFPIPLGEAAAFDPAAAELSAEVAAREAAAVGLKWTFAPMVDIARDARWGRMAEGAGEDVFLGEALARARVRGFQGADPSAPDRVIACAKHWVAYGAAEAGRDYNTVDLSERTLRQVYLPPFKAALDAGVGTLMTAFNDLNGLPASGNSGLAEVLRGDWGFGGVVVSDYESVKELMNHRTAADEAEAARLGLSTGVDVEMVSRLYATHVPRLLQEGRLTMAQVDGSVLRVLRLKQHLGLFDRPYVDPKGEGVLLAPEHRAAARRVAARSMVLLKNEGVLPFGPQVRTVALIGPLGDDPKAVLGSWSGDGRPGDSVTVLQGLRARGLEVRFAKGVALDGPGTTGNFDDPAVAASNAGGTNVAAAGGVDPARLATTPVGPGGIEEAVALARQADAVVVVVGETAEMSGEAASRTDLDLPGRQLDLVKAVHATGKPYAVVLMNGRPLTINWLAENSPAVLEAWFSGTEAGHAVADVLFGDANPGGKLPVTFPRTVGQVPLYYAHKSTGRPPSPAKYTSKYLDSPVTPLYPFGHGLSYTTFALRDLQVSPARLGQHDSVTVSVTVQNTGARAGDEVVQLYVQDVASTITRPVKELRGFQRVTLEPGESRRLQFVLGRRELGFYDVTCREAAPVAHWVVEPGAFKVWAATSSEGGLEGAFEVTP